MIKVLEEGKEPKATIRCPNCNSLLEYSNSDIQQTFKVPFWSNTPVVVSRYIFCPICSCKIVVEKIR